jgi:hypothetical protein
MKIKLKCTTEEYIAIRAWCLKNDIKSIHEKKFDKNYYIFIDSEYLSSVSPIVFIDNEIYEEMEPLVFFNLHAIYDPKDEGLTKEEIAEKAMNYWIKKGEETVNSDIELFKEYSKKEVAELLISGMLLEGENFHKGSYCVFEEDNVIGGNPFRFKNDLEEYDQKMNDGIWNVRKWRRFQPYVSMTKEDIEKELGYRVHIIEPEEEK